MKRKIKLTEGMLHRIIENSVKRIIKESDLDDEMYDPNEVGYQVLRRRFGNPEDSLNFDEILENGRTTWYDTKYGDINVSIERGSQMVKINVDNVNYDEDGYSEVESTEIHEMTDSFDSYNLCKSIIDAINELADEEEENIYNQY